MPKKSAFFWFMLEHRKRLEAKGRRFRCLKDVVPLASEVWKEMDATERERYARRDERRSRPGKSATPANVANDMDEEKDWMVAALQKRLQKAELDETLGEEVFYLISMEYFCRTSNGLYFPAELGLVKFNLRGGVQDQLHMLIDPGHLPYGYALEAQTHATQTHGLPLPPNARGEKNYEDIASKIYAFLVPEDGIAGLPMLFTAAETVPAVQSMLQHLFGKRMCHNLHVCSVDMLLYQWKLAVEHHMMSTTEFPSLALAQQIISTDTFACAPKIACEYHEIRELQQHCALARSIRWAYMISQNCCKELCIDLIPGKHVPIDTVIDMPGLDDTTTNMVPPDINQARFEDTIKCKN